MDEGGTQKKGGKKSFLRRFTDGNKSTTKQDFDSGNHPEVAAPTQTSTNTRNTPASDKVGGAKPSEPLSGYDVEPDVIESAPPTIAIEGTGSNPHETLGREGQATTRKAGSFSATPRPGHGVIPTAIPKPRKPLLVEDAINDDNSVAVLHPTTMEILSLFKGDSIIVRGKRRRDTVLIVLSDHTVEEGKILLNRVARNNLRVKLGDSCKVNLCSNIQYVKRVYIAPFEDSVRGLSGNLFDNYLKPYFLGAYRPLRKGDTFLVRHNSRAVEFKVVEIDPPEYGIVGPATVIYTDAEIIKREDEEEDMAEIRYDNVGGYRRQLAELRELLETAVLHPHIFRSIGCRPPRGVLLCGPPGTGKTLIAYAAANETNAFFYPINAHRIVSKSAYENNNGLQGLFEAAKKNSPAIIFIDEIDAIASKRGKLNVDMERRLFSQLVRLLDGIPSRSNVFVIGATNKRHSIDPALCRLGRLERTIEFGFPNETERLEILLIQMRRMVLEDDVDIEQIAVDTHGYVGSDLVLLCSEAAMQQTREKRVALDSLEDEDGGTEESRAAERAVLESLRVTMADFRFALTVTKPSSRTKVVGTTTKRGGGEEEGPPILLEDWLVSLDESVGRRMADFRFAELYDTFERRGIDTLEVFNELGKDSLMHQFGLSFGVALKLAKWAKDDFGLGR